MAHQKASATIMEAVLEYAPVFESLGVDDDASVEQFQLCVGKQPLMINLVSKCLAEGKVRHLRQLGDANPATLDKLNKLHERGACPALVAVNFACLLANGHSDYESCSNGEEVTAQMIFKSVSAAWDVIDQTKKAKKSWADVATEAAKLPAMGAKAIKKITDKMGIIVKAALDEHRLMGVVPPAPEPEADKASKLEEQAGIQCSTIPSSP